MLFALIMLFTQPNFELNADELGYYEFTGIQIVKINDHFLFSSYPDNALHLLNSKGDVVHKYQQSGEGPDALLSHYVIGFDDKHIYVHSHRRRFVVFDRALRFVTSFKTEEILQGLGVEMLAKKAPNIMVLTSPFVDWMRRTHAVQVKIENGKPILLSEHLKTDDMSEPFTEDPGAAQIRILVSHGETMFLYSPFIRDLKRKEYRIIVLSGLEDQLEMAYEKMLFGSLEGIVVPDAKRRGYLSKPLVLERGGYIAMVMSTHRHEGNRVYWDFFSKDGTFLKRQEQDGYRVLLPVTNSSDVFLAEEDGQSITITLVDQDDLN